MRVLKTKWFTRFAKKNGILDKQLSDAVNEVERGIVDADLGGGLVKKRVARHGGGKSGGYRTIIVYSRGEKAFFIFGFAKNERDNIDDKDVAELRDAAREYAKLTDTQITAAVVMGQLTEIKEHGKRSEEI